MTGPAIHPDAPPPRVTYVVACHDYGRYLAATLDSLLGQDFREIEILAIDDASTDETASVLRRHADDPRLRIVRHEQRQGHIRCNNEGMSLARGEFVGVFDADDFLIRTDATRRQVAIFDSSPRVGLVYSAYLLVDEAGAPYRSFQPWPADYVQPGLAEFKHLVHACYVQHSGTLVRRSAHSAGAVYDATLPHSADWDVWLRIATRNDVGYIADPLLAYRMHRSQMSQRRISPAVATDNLLRTVDKAFASLDRPALAQVGHLRRSARKSALLHQTRTDRSHGRTRRSWSGLADAARRCPSLLVDREFLWALVRLIGLTVVGQGRYSRIVTLRDRVAGGKAPIA